MLPKQSVLYKKIVSFVTKTLYVSIIICTSIVARESDEEVHQLRVGNFAVPGSMQPGPLLGFGQNIIDQFDTLAVVYPIMIFGERQHFIDIAPEVLYGVRDDLSLILAFPTAVSFKYDGHHSSGSLDTIVQLEYAPYSQHKPTETNQISFVGSMIFPTGNECKQPATGFGSLSFFLGAVGVHLATEWYGYTSFGVLFPTKSDNVKPGNHIIYQAGVGKNIAYRAEKWTLMWMLELSGIYNQKTKVNGIKDPNSGSNTVIMGPALWFSTDRFLLEAGIAPVISEHVFGDQFKTRVNASIYTGWRFN